MIANMISQPFPRPVMLRRLALLYMSLCVGAFAPACSRSDGASDAPAAVPPRYVAHAGGAANGHVVTNSLEALNDSVARDHTFIEVDFSWTSDDRLVLLHDWHQTTERLFGAPQGEMTHADFMAAPSQLGLTQLDADGLFAWLSEHPRIVIVTDIKGRSTEALARIARAHPELLPRIVPQLYAIEEHEPVVALGYPRVILTLYATPMEDEAVLAYAREHAPLAVTMPMKRAAGPLPHALDALDVFSYAHTTSDYLAAAELFRNGIDGIYTDYLAPKDDALAFDEAIALPWSVSVTDEVPLNGSAVTFLPMAQGLRARLVAENPGETVAIVSGVARDAGGAELGRADWTVAAGALEELPLDSFDAAAAATLWLRPGGCSLSMTWELPGRPSVDILVAESSWKTHSFVGLTDGQIAHAVLLVNPDNFKRTYRCVQTWRPPGARAALGQGTIIRSVWLRVPPNGMVRSVLELPGPGAVELRVSGGPVVVQPLRWSSTFSVLR